MLFSNIFLNISSLTSAKIFFAIALYPLLYLITLFLPTYFMHVVGVYNGFSGLDFYFVSVLFYEVYSSGKLIFYKDIKRTKLLNTKLFTLITIYTIYFFILFIVSEVLYFTFIKNFNYASGMFLPTETEDMYSDILS